MKTILLLFVGVLVLSAQKPKARVPNTPAGRACTEGTLKSVVKTWEEEYVDANNLCRPKLGCLTLTSASFPPTPEPFWKCVNGRVENCESCAEERDEAEYQKRLAEYSKREAKRQTVSKQVLSVREIVSAADLPVRDEGWRRSGSYMTMGGTDPEQAAISAATLSWLQQVSMQIAALREELKLLRLSRTVEPKK